MVLRKYNKAWRAVRLALGMAMTAGLMACSGGGGGNGATGATIGGGGVKGPMANATVTVYAFDASQPGFKGAAVGSGTTDGSAAITGLSLPFPLNPPYIMEFTANAGTTDITTGQAPVITELRTVITQSLLDKGEQIYATPLTTMAVDLAVANADKNTPLTAGGTTIWPGNNDGSTTAAEFEAALPLAATQVASTVGFGIDGNVDIFDTPPLLDSTTDSLEEQANVAAYRTAVEAVSAVVYEMSQQAAGDTNTVLAELAGDLADGAIDGTVDGQPSDVFTGTTLDVLDQDPATLPIPNSDDGSGNPITVGEVESAVLATETATTGATTDTTALTDGTIDTAPAPASTNPDRDGDGIPNADDAFPDDAAAALDTDGDGLPDTVDTTANPATNLTADTDDDNDGVDDTTDAFPQDASEQFDTDNDTIGNNADPDDDNDGVPDVDDAFPIDPAASSFNDPDGDGWPVGQDSDDADATVPATPFVDSDGDGLADSGGLNPDADDDNDGVPDVSDAFPLDASEQFDTDGDTLGNNADSDDDGDGVIDTLDAFPLDAGESRDLDHDGIGDNSDPDADGDGVDNVTEGSGNTPATDTDSDGTPDWLDRDSDNDGIPDASDANRTVVDVPNTAPLATGTSLTTGEDTPASGSVTATDAENDPITFSLVAQAGNGTAAVNGDGTFTYTPNADYSGSDSFTVVASDASASSNVVTVSVTVTPVNDAPVTTDGALTVAEDSSANAGTVSGTDIEGDALTFALASGPANGSVTVNADGTFSYTPNANFNGTDSFTFTANDGTVDSAPATVTITVTPVNDAPVATAGTLTVAEDNSANAGTVSGTDTDGDTLTYALSAGPANGTATVNSDGSYTYTPNANFNGSDSFTFVANDGTVDSAPAAVTITVTPVNDAPVANADTASVIPNGLVVIDVLANDTDIDGDTLSVVAGDAVSANSVTVVNNGNGTFTYTDATGTTGTDSFSYTLTDGTVNVTGTVTVNIVANTPPAITQGASVSVTMDEDGNPAAFSLTLDATDAENDPLTWSVTTPAANGSASATGNGASVSVGYTPNADFNGSDSFVVGVNDGTSTTTITVNVTINPVNDAPVISGIAPAATLNTAYSFVPTASDVDGDTLTFSLTGTLPAGLGFNPATGEISGTPTATGTASLTITVSDGTASAALGPFDLTVGISGAVWDNFNWDDGSTWQ